MKKHFFNTMLVLSASIITLIATTVSASACVWGSYQPVEPKSLREE